MGDLSIESFYACESNEHFQTIVKSSDKTKDYTVKFGAVFGSDVMYDWSCDCPASKYGNGKPCKHIKSVEDAGLRCGWNQQIDGGAPVLVNGEQTCPKCGGPTIVFRAGV